MFYLANTLSEPRSTVLIFDSGVGGLSVYNEVRNLLPDLHYIYAFDNAAFPYGEKGEKFIIERVLKIITSIIQRYPPSLAIIACNTASVVSLSTIRRRFPFPIIGVVPAIKSAAHLTKNGIIGLLATHRTIKSPYTRNLITNFANKYYVKMLGSTELVELAEAKLHGEIISLDKVRNILHPWLCVSKLPDTIVLGCTHFSLLQETILTVLPDDIRLVDSNVAIAHRTAWILKYKALNSKSNDLNRAFCTIQNAVTTRLLPILYQYGFSILEEITL